MDVRGLSGWNLEEKAALRFGVFCVNSLHKLTNR
jgi:hypothetical protein